MQGAFSIFLWVEVFRVLNVPPIAWWMNQYMKPFLDTRDEVEIFVPDLPVLGASPQQMSCSGTNSFNSHLFVAGMCYTCLVRAYDCRWSNEMSTDELTVAVQRVGEQAGTAEICSSCVAVQGLSETCCWYS